ncbi:MAG: trypsin-like peptidase domain-containing protein [Clostridiales bacterium]|nr:trypsin-like peptidase domain-containing protein [Clostridiales bacterium]
MSEHKKENYYLELTASPQVNAEPIIEHERVQIQALTISQALPQQKIPTPSETQPQADYIWQSALESEQEQKINFTPAYAPYGRKNKKKSKGYGLSRLAVVALMFCCLVFSSILGFGGGWLAGHNNNPVTSVTESNYAPDSSAKFAAYLADHMAALPEGIALTTAQIAALTADSVVEIETQVAVAGYNFFGRSIADRLVPAAGSGVIIAETGYIITNNHVIENAQKIDITLRNGQKYEAKLIATDPKTDVAVIKIEAAGLKAATIGDSKALVVGEPAVVIGNPLGQLGGTVTSGIISALDRAVTFQEDDGTTKTMNLLQTDASINSGNSGGGLFNQYGELVGIVVAKSSGIAIEGLGFAIPVNDVRGVIDDLITYGYARGRIALGVSLINIPDEQSARRNNLTTPGVYILRVEAGSNAERGGLKQVDRIVRINGTEITEAAQVSEAIQKLSVGDSLTVEYEREGKPYSVNITMQETVPESIRATKTSY